MKHSYLVTLTILIVTPALMAQSKKAESRVNEHIQRTHKKIEIEAEKRQVELQKTAPRKLKPLPAAVKTQPFIVTPPRESNDKGVLRDHYDLELGKDPSTEFEQQIIDGRNSPTVDEERAEYIRQFKANAAKAGVAVEVDPKTLKARPVGNGSK